MPLYAQKQIYIPKDLRQMDLHDADSQWNYARMDTTCADFAIFWEKGFGNDLANPPQLEGHDMRVDLGNLKRKLERFYEFFRDTLRFVEAGSKSERYRMMVMLNYSLDGTAYGGDYDQTIGALWIAPNRVQDEKLNCVAHELGHSFQSQVSCDSAGVGWGGCGFYEMASQWMLWQVNPDWMTDEEYHWKAFTQLTHKAYLHLENIYHSPYILEYWGMKRGLPSIAELFRQGTVDEDVVMTYKRMYGLSQAQFCDEMFDAVRHIVNLDYPRAWQETRPYACALTTPLERVGGGWYQVGVTAAPENYGFNAIPLQVPTESREVTVSFRGLPTTNATAEQAAAAGWRYGFLAVTADGKSVYGDMATEANGKLTFTLPEGQVVSHLYLVVMGAPTRHWRNPGGFFSPEPPKVKDVAWPYQVRFDGTQPVVTPVIKS